MPFFIRQSLNAKFYIKNKIFHYPIFGSEIFVKQISKKYRIYGAFLWFRADLNRYSNLWKRSKPIRIPNTGKQKKYPRRYGFSGIYHEIWNGHWKRSNQFITLYAWSSHGYEYVGRRLPISIRSRKNPFKRYVEIRKVFLCNLEFSMKLNASLT